MRVGYLGPEGTFTEEALLAEPPAEDVERIALPTVHDTVMAVHEGAVERAIVPIENSVEGSVNATLDTLALEATGAVIVGETVRPIRQCLVAREPLDLGDIETVVSHPQASAQCARFLRDELPGATLLPASSTAEAVRLVAASDRPLAALGTRLAAGRYGCTVLREGVEDTSDNVTRFVWLAPAGTEPREGDAWKTSVVFWGAGDDAPGWLVRCLSEFAFRGVNLTLIESRPRRGALGHYMFFADLSGRASDPAVAGAIEALRGQTEVVRVLGSYPTA